MRRFIKGLFLGSQQGCGNGAEERLGCKAFLIVASAGPEGSSEAGETLHRFLQG